MNIEGKETIDVLIETYRNQQQTCLEIEDVVVPGEIELFQLRWRWNCYLEGEKEE